MKTHLSNEERLLMHFIRARQNNNEDEFLDDDGHEIHMKLREVNEKGICTPYDAF